MRHLTQRGIGVVITDHNVRETLNMVNRAYIIYDGQVLIHGKPQEIIANEMSGKSTWARRSVNAASLIT